MLNLSNSHIEYLEEGAFTFNEQLQKTNNYPTVDLKNNNLDCCVNIKELYNLASYDQNITCILVQDTTKTNATIVDIYSDNLGVLKLDQKCKEVLNLNNSGVQPNNQVGLIVGLVVGLLVLIVLALGIAFFLYNTKNKKQDLLQGQSAFNFVMNSSELTDDPTKSITEYESLESKDENDDNNNKYDGVDVNYDNSESNTSVINQSEYYANVCGEQDNIDVYHNVSGNYHDELNEELDYGNLENPVSVGQTQAYPQLTEKSHVQHKYS
eukprot:Pgem_evm2s676